MTTSLVLTFMGRDKPGLANAISETIAAAGGSWMDSRLARLADKFAGIVLVTCQNRTLPISAQPYAASTMLACGSRSSPAAPPRWRQAIKSSN